MFKKLIPRKSASRWLGSETELELEKHFRIEKKLGKGSYAVVYQAQRLADGCHYALKVADVNALGAPERADVVNEIRLLSSLSHPNLTTFYEAFCDHGKLCIVQELVGGGDIASFIRRRSAASMHFTENQVWALLLQIALGLQHLHHHRVLHRDLKPQNILITEGGLIKLADLGISAELDRVFESVMIGTPHYMAPEMWRRQPYSYSADIWALGCIVHELCTLKPLFLGGSDKETQQKVLSGAMPPPPARYSPELRALVSGMLQQSPAERPTIDDLLHSTAAAEHLGRLPEELQRCLASPAALSVGRGLALLMQPIRVPQQADEWHALNELMPTPRFPSGSGVTSALRKKKSWSTGDLQALAAAEAEASRGASFSGDCGGLSAGEVAAEMRKVQSFSGLAAYGSLAAAVEAELERSSSVLTRRKSLSVGEVLAPAGSSPGLRRRASFSSNLGAVPEEEAGAATSPTGSATAAPAVGGPQERQLALGEGRSVRDMRSKSLSVEDAVEVVTSGRQVAIPIPIRLRAQQPAPSPAASPAAASPSPADSGGSLEASGTAAAAALLPPFAGISQPGVPLAVPGVTAQVQVSGALPQPAGSAGSSLKTLPQPEALEAGSGKGEKKGRKRVSFWGRQKEKR